MKLVKKTFVGKKEVYDISVAGVEHYILENGIVTHNTGSYYSSNDIWIIGRQQDKDGKELEGFHFIINIEKSRFVKEKSRIPITVRFDSGIGQWSGLWEEALEAGIIVSPKKGKYALAIDPEQEFKRDDMDLDDVFWQSVLDGTNLKEFIENKYKLSSNQMIRVEETHE
jgi:hypothetical protein